MCDPIDALQAMYDSLAPSDTSQGVVLFHNVVILIKVLLMKKNENRPSTDDDQVYQRLMELNKKSIVSSCLTSIKAETRKPTIVC
jgi:hypothetical protein